jgi:hypothetical protein
MDRRGFFRKAGGATAVGLVAGVFTVKGPLDAESPEIEFVPDELQEPTDRLPDRVEEHYTNHVPDWAVGMTMALGKQGWPALDQTRKPAEIRHVERVGGNVNVRLKDVTWKAGEIPADAHIDEVRVYNRSGVLLWTRSLFTRGAQFEGDDLTIHWGP